MGIVLLVIVYSRTYFKKASVCYAYSITEDNLPEVILVWALVSTAIYSYRFLLREVTKKHDVIFHTNPSAGEWFHNIWLAALLFTVGVALGYGYSFVELTCPIPTTNALADVSTGWSSSFWGIVGWIWGLIVDMHLLAFVLLYSTMDFIVSRWGDDTDDKKLFTEVLIIVDAPIVISMAFIEILIHTGLRDISFVHLKYLEAGVVAFQLMAGGLVICVFEALKMSTPAKA